MLDENEILSVSLLQAHIIGPSLLCLLVRSGLLEMTPDVPIMLSIVTNYIHSKTLEHTIFASLWLAQADLQTLAR